MRETGITIGQVIGLAADGLSIEEIVHDFGGQIDRDDVRDALIFALRLTS